MVRRCSLLLPSSTMRNTTADQDATEASGGFAPASWSSSLGVSDALASYTRSQVIITGQNVASSLDTDARTEVPDEEAQVHEEEVPDEDDLPTPVPDNEGFEWDDVLAGPTLAEPETAETERTPLIRKAPSRASVRVQPPYVLGRDRLEPPSRQDHPRLRRKSSASGRSEKEIIVGRSTYGQTVSNAPFGSRMSF